MGKAKAIELKPIAPRVANVFMKQHHYSGKVVQNSQIHIGVFLGRVLHGAMQFGPSLDKRKLQGLVKGTKWHEFIELNRMAFDEALPRNSESRAISVAMRLLKKYAPQIKWVISFADATQCGDGAIYRASGFVLTSIKENQQLYTLPFSRELDEAALQGRGLSGDDITWIKLWLDEITPVNGQSVVHRLTVQDRPPRGRRPTAHKITLGGGHRPSQTLSEVKKIMRRLTNGKTSADIFFRAIGGQITTGYQLRYIYFIDKSYRQQLTVPEVPYARIEEVGARMYKGRKLS